MAIGTSGTRRVTVSTGADGPTPALRYATDRVSGERVRYPQVGFDEHQKGDPAELQQDALFYAATNHPWDAWYQTFTSGAAR
ncbi:hypothetical protein AB0F91_30955 [Amycolatopsis sp. NPDC023774]|uniref:hypothetical protein n=1 Tax=Amycolatopsis sp. NPDC023774 TaxID=3155015 RepID=UPI0033CBF515